MIGPYAVACNHMWAFMESIGVDILVVTWLCTQYGHPYPSAPTISSTSATFLDAGMMWIWPDCASSLQTSLHVHCLGDTHISTHSMRSPMNWMIAQWSCLANCAPSYHTVSFALAHPVFKICEINITRTYGRIQ
jgi:hypothetical protein